LLACLEGEFRVAKLQLTSATESKGWNTNFASKHRDDGLD
jgi:hypothetical protein